jgi:hypothetical protein
MAQFFEKHLAVTAWLEGQKNISTLYVDYNQMLTIHANAQKINIFLGVI